MLTSSSYNHTQSGCIEHNDTKSDTESDTESDTKSDTESDAEIESWDYVLSSVVSITYGLCGLNHITLNQLVVTRQN